MARHKPAAQGGYQRGEETRERIVEAALGVFGERGYEGASTREIAAAAGVNAPALQYYFDNKEGVYVACIEYIVKRIWLQVATFVEAAEALLVAADVDDQQLIEAHLQILGSFFAFIHDTPQSTSWRQFMAREHAELGPTTAFERIDNSVHWRIGDVSCAIIGRLTGMPAKHEETILRTFAINSQAMAFRVLRRKVLKALEWDSIDRERMERIRDLLVGQTRITLEGLVKQRDA
jgi:AcrR family transcriptional regulator